MTQLRHRDPEFDKALSDYISRFEFKVTLKLGQSYNQDFATFNQWCEDRLGTKYKDWFLYPMSKDTYRLYCRESKWSIFLTLTHVDKIV
jgi:hypothetical protein